MHMIPMLWWYSESNFRVGFRRHNRIPFIECVHRRMRKTIHTNVQCAYSENVKCIAMIWFSDAVTFENSMHDFIANKLISAHIPNGFLHLPQLENCIKILSLTCGNIAFCNENVGFVFMLVEKESTLSGRNECVNAFNFQRLNRILFPQINSNARN